MIDEPELNLHPENQRKIARLLASLANCGLSIFVTTHSDYILRELSNLLLLKQEKEHVKKIVENEKYMSIELLDYRMLKVYTAGESVVKIPGNSRSSRIQTIVQNDVNQVGGIQASSFDNTIDKMNSIQDQIFFGG